MPAYNPSQLHELVQDRIQDNNNNLIDPADVRQVLDAIIDSVYNLVATPNPEAPKLENVLLEGNQSGPMDIVMSTGRYVVFKGTGSNSVRVRPLQSSGGGPNVEVNLPLKPGTLALLEDIGRSAWLQPVLGQRDQQAGTEVAGDRWVVGPGASGDFAGHAGDIVERTNDGWVFTATQNGDMVRCLSDGAGVIRTKIGGVWVMPETMADVLSLSLVLGIGNMTGGHDIEVSATDAVAFRNNGHLMRLVGQDIAEDHTVIMPDAGGTLATVQQVAQLLFGIDLHAVLVNGTETNGRSITVSEGDGINYRAGTKQVRVKAPTTLTADRNMQWPDKSGTVATTDDVDAIAALVDGTMRAPEAYTPTGGLYPATYGGGAIQKGDTFRLGGGTMGGVTVDPEDLLVALVDAPGQSNANWQVLESNRVVATQAEAEDNASTDTTKLMPPMRWWQAWSKGLTLASFLAAVRGAVLTGYTVGSNVAVAATDSIMGAVAKLQGQINTTNTAVGGKLAKASNLSDLTNAVTARGNLGLGLLAVEDGVNSTEVRSPDGVPVHTVEDAIPAWLSSTDPNNIPFIALDYEPGVPTYTGGTAIPGKWVLAQSGRNGGRVIGFGVGVSNVTGSALDVVHIYTGGEFYLPVRGGTPVIDPTGGTPNSPWCLTNTPGVVLPQGSPSPPGVTIDEGKVVVVSNPGPAPSLTMRCQIIGAPGAIGGGSSGVQSQLVQLTDGFTTNLGTAAGGQTMFDSLLSTMTIQPGVYQVELKLGLKVKDTVNSPAHAGFASVALEVTPNTVSSKAYGTLTMVQKPTGAAGLSDIASEGYDKPVRTWTALNDAGDDVLQVTVLRGIVAIPSNATGGVEASRYWRVRIASSDADHTVSNVGTSYIVWTKIKGV